jgi:hypothetical protein
MTGPSKPDPDKDRDERLAAALRENLKRRKAQARSQASSKQEKMKQPPEEKTGG